MGWETGRSTCTACAWTPASWGARPTKPARAGTSICGRAICRRAGREPDMGKNHPTVEDYVVSRVRALESLLLEKGLLAPDAVDRVIQRYESQTGPMLGARAVARAWLDPAYKRRLLEDSPAALGDFGVRDDRLVVVENTAAIHNLIVCTLCSCYPWDVLGLPPTWYKMPAYRS